MQPGEVETLKHAHPIETVIAAYGITLRPAGQALVGRCPFHADHGRPNLHVYPATQSFYCYRCHIGGDVIRFVEQIEGVDFTAAVQRLTDTNALMPSVHRPPCTSSKRRRLDDAERVVLAAAVDVYHASLLADPAALAYLHARGLSLDTLRRYRLGYVQGRELLPHLRQQGLSVAAARCVELLRHNREFLHRRIVIPAFQKGQPVWLIGRALHGNPNAPKYLGLPGAKPLLGWDEARHETEVYVVEGPFDWLTLRQWGLPALALVGTHASPEALQLLTRFERVYLALDNDDAGRAATEKLLMRHGRRAVPVYLHDVKDVADLAPHTDGRARFLDLVAASLATLNSRRGSLQGDTKMAYSINRVELIGRLGRDVELRYTPDGHAVANLSLATDRPTKPEAERETDWHRVVCWGQTAEFCGEYLGKGRLVFVAGRLTYRKWEGKDGQKHITTEVIASEVMALDRRPDAPPADPPPSEPPPSGDDIDF